MKNIVKILTAALLALLLTACGTEPKSSSDIPQTENKPSTNTISQQPENTNSSSSDDKQQEVNMPENFVLVKGGTFDMGSPNSEPWRSNDEMQHSVTVSDFYIGIYEVTQSEYQNVMEINPSNFKGDDLPVESVSWYDAISFCNARSKAEGLTPAYSINGNNVSWDRSANGYRLPTEAEWEYACRAGTTTPFNTENSISADESNYWGSYPYLIEDNYFNQGNLETKPGVYRQKTVSVNSFSPNKLGLYNMHGNVGEWVWDLYGEYGSSAQTNPTGAASGTRRVYRGGGWNDFAKNLRSAYRAAFPAENGSFNIGFRLVRNVTAGSGSISGQNNSTETSGGSGKLLIAYFSWGGNTRGIANEIRSQTGADIFEIELVHPYSSSYNTVLNEAQRDQNKQARPEIKNKVENMAQYDTVILGYPNWWASIPMPIASFIEEYDFSGKTIVPFCSHGGGRFGQSLTAIAKLAPNSTIAEGLAISYSGGSGLSSDVSKWLDTNNIPKR